MMSIENNYDQYRDQDTLDFSSANIDIDKLSEQLKLNKCLKHLNLYFTKLKFDGLKKILDSLESNDTLDYLNISRNDIKNQGAELLGEFIQKHPNIKTLICGLNDIGDDGLKSLSQALKIVIFEHLDLSYNFIGEKGISVIMDSLKSNDKITYLDLSKNNLHNGVKELTEFINKNTSLRHLDLSYNSLTEQGILEISQSLKQNRNLTSLDLSNNYLQLLGANYLIDMLKYNYTIIQLGFNGNSIESREKELELSDLILLNNINSIKLCMLMCRKRRDNVISILPRRLLIHLLDYLNLQIKHLKNSVQTIQNVNKRRRSGEFKVDDKDAKKVEIDNNNMIDIPEKNNNK
eukprot:TRINITY_DN9374_c0_g1_i1.p1 TRINITY_DN9374_c0_g1~~TRINITY_DN9374_c0_g1_i1.p1  ORF type:complete len:348 (-),score=81.47 TRINITY_DN9374_c0_g1_i1:1-1044(-)